MYTVTLVNQKSYSAAAGQTLLDAAHSAGLALEYSCGTGRCGVCKTRVVGQTQVVRPELALTEADLAEGWQLTCCRAAASDVQLDVADLGALAQIKVQTLPCRIDRLQLLAPDVLQVVLRLPPTSRFDFLPGQYLSVIAPGGVQRSYSIAHAPRADQKIELHIRRVPGGQLSQYWFESAKVNDLLRLRGPLGTFCWREGTREQVIFLATGTGMAPIQALLGQLVAQPELMAGRTLHVYWGGRQAQDLYLPQPVPTGLRAQFSPVLSRPASGEPGRHVQTAVLADGIPLGQATVYACGSDAMIHDARAQLVAAGLEPHQFYADAFVSSL